MLKRGRRCHDVFPLKGLEYRDIGILLDTELRGCAYTGVPMLHADDVDPCRDYGPIAVPEKASIGIDRWEALIAVQESLLMNSVGIVSRRGSRSGLAMRPRSSSAMCLPICSGNSRIVVSAGYKSPPTVSLHPATLMSSGMRKPCSRSPLYTPHAVGSLPAKMAVNGSPAGEQVFRSQVSDLGIVLGVDAALTRCKACLFHTSRSSLRNIGQTTAAGYYPQNRYADVRD